MQIDAAIHVDILSRNSLNNLVPRYDLEANILEVGTPNIRHWPYGVDIDGNIIFDLDQQYLLVNFDLLIPRQLWQKIDDLSYPLPVRCYDLRFQKSTLNIKSFHLPLVVYSNQEASVVLIRWDSLRKRERIVTLSKNCQAILAGSTLIGFYIHLLEKSN